MILLWVLVFVVSIGATSYASRRAVVAALRVATALKISPAVVGLTVMSIGTDLPEIANSLVSSAGGHGDVLIGDSMGSAVTQMTLTMGLLAILARGKLTANRNFVIAVGTATAFAMVVVRLLADDGDLSHVDGVLLILVWLVGTAMLGHGELKPREVFTSSTRGVSTDLVATLAWLAAVGVFAVGVIESFLQLADRFGVPEFLGSFIVLSIGTSLPELFVDWNAIRSGASSMAIGDLFGSSFVDATLAAGIGPAVFSTMVSTDALAGVNLAAVGVVITTVVVARAKTYDWRLGIHLLVLYAAVQVAAYLLVGA